MVAEAAVASHSDWVIKTCRRRAEEIIDQGRSQYYDEAITRLEKLRDAHVAAGREEEWRDYLDDLVSRHQRKYKLRPMLQDLAQ
jgi:uncharacterized Zn finger protein